MDAAEIRIIHLAQQIAQVGAQGAKAYNDAQAELRLEWVLAPIRLGSVEGTRESLAALERLSQVTAAHKEMFAKFSAAATAQLLAAIKELPADRAQEYQASIASSINWNMEAQARFYAQRSEWITVAIRICQLVDIHRRAIEFREGELLFSDDAALEEFVGLVSRADELHQLEVAQTAQRIARLSQSLAVLGLHAP
jgi:hypothetical protein